MTRRRRGRTQRAPAIDIVVQSALWNARRGVKPLLRRAIAAAAGAVSTRDGELAIVLTNDSAIRALNRKWRRRDAPTNVLSFPSSNPRQLGDIVLACETVAREAKAERKPFEHHVAHLAVHGFLHLAGYDHATDAEAGAMEGLEVKVLARLGVPNPYTARPDTARPGKD
jgi:probable rRNA maturation factor